MYSALSPGAIGVNVSTLEERVSAAREGGFAGVELDAGEVARRGADEVRSILGEIRPAGWGLPTDWRADEPKFQASLAELPRLAEACSAVGCTRTATWIMPASDDMECAENRAFHVDRFGRIARVLADFGCSIGLEFIGPKTLRDRFKHPFIWTGPEMLAMCRDIGPNAGLLLDCWHWYTSGGTVEEILAMRASDVVYVHVNDAPAGVPLDEQVDNVRCLPGETGVIPIADFLRALTTIGYDGPVVPEPFKKELADLPSDADRVRVVGDAMQKLNV
jgi:sugar phosphate isomerase/epimerase